VRAACCQGDRLACRPGHRSDDAPGGVGTDTTVAAPSAATAVRAGKATNYDTWSDVLRTRPPAAAAVVDRDLARCATGHAAGGAADGSRLRCASAARHRTPRCHSAERLAGAALSTRAAQSAPQPHPVTSTHPSAIQPCSKLGKAVAQAATTYTPKAPPTFHFEVRGGPAAQLAKPCSGLSCCAAPPNIGSCAATCPAKPPAPAPANLTPSAPPRAGPPAAAWL
jgi:hypothetical protein